jgi:hypothetical protein
MIATCKECGATIQTPTNDREHAEDLLAKHKAEQHGSLEQRMTPLLTKCLAVVKLVSSGGKVPKENLLSLERDLSTALKIPFESREVLPLSTEIKPSPKPIPSTIPVAPQSKPSQSGNTTVVVPRSLIGEVADFIKQHQKE